MSGFFYGEIVDVRFAIINSFMYFCYVDESGDAGAFDPERPEEKFFCHGARKKYGADRIFDNRLTNLLYRSAISDDDGLIRL